MLKKNLFKYSSVLLSVMVAVSSLMGCGNNTVKSETAVVKDVSTANSEDAINTAISSELAIENKSTLEVNSREETVYVFADANGNQDHIIVNEKITDEKGNESSNQTASDKQAPITMKVTYKLDGKDISPEELAGKSGKVTIRYDYTNNEKQQDIYTPFTMVTGMLLPSETFSNVEVTNGKLTKVGDKIVALGITMPGLSDTLKVDIDIPEYFELTADVNNFELEMSMSVATTNFLSDIDVENISIDELKNKLTQLQDGSDKLVAGTQTLSSGTDKLAQNMPALTDGTLALSNGSNQLKDGIYAYTNGALAVNEGAIQLSDGIDTLYETLENKGLDSSVEALAEGSESLYNGLNDNLVGSLVTNMSTYENVYANAYNTAYQQVLMANAYSYVAVNTATFGGATFSQLPDATKAQVLAGVKAQLEANGIGENADIVTAAQNDNNQATSITAALMKIYAANPTDEALMTYTTQIATMNQALAAYKTLYASYSSIMQSGLLEGAAQLSGGLSQLKSSIGSFDNYSEGTLCSSLYAIKIGANTLSNGTKELTANNSTLKTGSENLANGADTLNNSCDTLAKGVNELNEGALTLKNGMLEFNETGIKAITGLVGDDADRCINSIKKAVEMGKNYNTFLGKNDGKKNSVTFIYKTDGIK